MSNDYSDYRMLPCSAAISRCWIPKRFRRCEPVLRNEAARVPFGVVYPRIPLSQKFDSVKFADSPLEGSRFELRVPRQMGHRFVTWLSSVTQPPSASVPHEHTLSRQCGDLGVGETTSAQHRLAMLVEARRRTSGSARRPRKLDRGTVAAMMRSGAAYRPK
jgi:hypothetical protein